MKKNYRNNRKIISYKSWSFIRLVPLAVLIILFYLFSYLLISEAVIRTLKGSLSDALDVYSRDLSFDLRIADTEEVTKNTIEKHLSGSIDFTNKYSNSVYLIYDFQKHNIFLKKPVNQAAEKNIIFGLKQNREIFHSSALNNSFYIFRSPIEKNDMDLILLIPTEHIDSISEPFIRALIYITSIILFLFIFSLYFITGHISRPFMNLADLIGLIESGLFSREFTDNTTAESELVSYRINKMVDEVKKLHSDIYLKEIEKSNAKLQALYAQINPHFLFNTLNSIKSLAYSNMTKEISDITTQLGKMLRYGIYDSSELVSLKREFNHVISYLKIQSYRNGELFSFDTDLPDICENLSVPKLILQPLAENYIKHGLIPDSHTEIKISCKKEPSCLLIFLKNTGKQIPDKKLIEIKAKLDNDQNTKSENGIGLRNVHQRIKELFGPAYGIEIKSDTETEIRIMLPIVKSEME